MVFSLLLVSRDLSVSSLFVHCRLATTRPSSPPRALIPVLLACQQSDPYRLPHLDGSVLVCHRASLIQGHNRPRPFPSERSPSFRFRQPDSVMYRLGQSCNHAPYRVGWSRGKFTATASRSSKPPFLPRRAGCAEPPTDLSVRITGDPR